MGNMQIIKSEKNLDVSIAGLMPSFRDLMIKNKSLCHFAIWIIKETAERCNQLGRDVTRVSFSIPASYSENKINFGINYNEGNSCIIKVHSVSSFENFIGSTNKLIYNLFRQNENYGKLFYDVAKLMENYCNWKGIKFEFLDFEKVLITPNDLCIITLKEFKVK